MARSRRTKVPAEEKTRLVLAVLAGEMTCAEAARRCGVTTVTMTKWKHQFLAAGAERLQEVPSGAAGAKGTPEQRRAAGRHFCETGPGQYRYTFSEDLLAPDGAAIRPAEPCCAGCW
jgi:transposase